MNTPQAETADTRWNWLYKIGGAAALFGVAVIPIQLIIFIAWGQPDTAIGWFKLFQEKRLAGLLAFEFLFVVNAVLGIATTLALYVALKRVNESFMAIALALGLVEAMKTIRAFIKRHPLLSYFALAFAISWGAILIAVGIGPGGFSATPQQLQMAVPYAVPAMLLGPGVAAILLTGLLYGGAGFRELRSRLLNWRVDARWYAVALLTAPLLITAVLLALSLVSPEFFPRIFTASDTASLVLMGIVVGVPTGIFEELGWTGFATPRMRLSYGVLGTGLFVGVLWGTWHLLINYWASGVTSGEISLAIWLPAWLIGTLVGQLTAYRVLMVWVYERTGSLLVAMLMHASLAVFTFILFPPLALVANLISGFAYAAALWVVVGAVALAQGGHLSRQPPLRRWVA